MLLYQQLFYFARGFILHLSVFSCGNFKVLYLKFCFWIYLFVQRVFDCISYNLCTCAVSAASYG